MRSAAKVGEIALLIKRNYAILGKVLYKLNSAYRLFYDSDTLSDWVELSIVIGVLKSIS